MIYKCKMCGGELDITGKENVCECPFCSVVQTIPSVNEEKNIQLYNRATFLLKSCEYDKASSIYEKIISDQGEQAEAYWGLCLCKYGIEYVDDPRTGEKIPTCHRTLTKSILKDSDYLKTLYLADAVAKQLYEKEAEYIDNVQKRILDISKSMDPYDVFICYKESDATGKRTSDSVLAEEIYDALTEKEYKVFFSKISLVDKLGQEYEPFIFSALTSAKIMLVIGTKAEYFNAPWVKNEWSRFLSLCNKGEKKYLIPCYKDMSPYEMPEEFINLQAQDMGKIGYLQDLKKGIDKLFERTYRNLRNSTKQDNDLPHSIFNELRQMLLLVKDSKRFDENKFNDKWSVLNNIEDPSNSMNPKIAPLSYSRDFLFTNKLLNFKYSKPKQSFVNIWELDEMDFNKLKKDEPELCNEIQEFLEEYSKDRDYLDKLQLYNAAIAFKKDATRPRDFVELYHRFDEIGDFKDAKRQAEFYKNKSNSIFDSSLKDFYYEKLINRISKFNTKSEKEDIIKGLNEISDYKDAKQYIKSSECKDPAKIEKKLSELNTRKQTLIAENVEIKKLENTISELKQELSDETVNLKKRFNDRKKLLENEISDIRAEYSESAQRLSRCGIFAVKEKKMLRDKLNILENKLAKTKVENGRQLQDLEYELNSNIEMLNSTYNGRISDCEKQIEDVIDFSEEIKKIDNEIFLNSKELSKTNECRDLPASTSKLWEPSNIKVSYDYWGFKILTFKLGKFPQSKVMAPSLVNELESSFPDNKGIYHLHGLEFCAINKAFYLVEPIEWKIIKHAYRNGKFYYLLTTKEVLEVKGPMSSGNVVKAHCSDKTCEFLMKEENKPVSLYKYSDIRKWLVNDFYTFAFNENEQKVICVAHIDNSAESTSDETTIFYTDDTEDNVFLLSYRACKKTHYGDDFADSEEWMNESFDDGWENRDKNSLLLKENSIVDNVLIPSFGLNVSDVSHEQYIPDDNLIYADACELCWFGGYSDYAFGLCQAKNYQSGALLRSPDTEKATGYNTCENGRLNSFGAQYKDGEFGIVNDILPCIILCLSADGEVVYPDENFDF